VAESPAFKTSTSGTPLAGWLGGDTTARWPLDPLQVRSIRTMLSMFMLALFAAPGTFPGYFKLRSQIVAPGAAGHSANPLSNYMETLSTISRGTKTTSADSAEVAQLADQSLPRHGAHKRLSSSRGPFARRSSASVSLRP
jgi:hypothetical protein